MQDIFHQQYFTIFPVPPLSFPWKKQQPQGHFDHTVVFFVVNCFLTTDLPISHLPSPPTASMNSKRLQVAIPKATKVSEGGTGRHKYSAVPRFWLQTCKIPSNFKVSHTRGGGEIKKQKILNLDVNYINIIYIYYMYTYSIYNIYILYKVVTHVFHINLHQKIDLIQLIRSSLLGRLFHWQKGYETTCYKWDYYPFIRWVVIPVTNL